MDSDPSVHEDEVTQKSSPPWLAWYRRYLYFALVLSAVGLLLSATVWGVGSFAGALLDVVVAAILLKSLKRIGEQRITMFHLVINGATLLTAIVLIIGNMFALPESILSLLMLVSVDFYVLHGLVYMDFDFVALAFLIISAYWLKNWYQFSSTTEGDHLVGEQAGQSSDDSDTASSDSDS